MIEEAQQNVDNIPSESNRYRDALRSIGFWTLMIWIFTSRETSAAFAVSSDQDTVEAIESQVGPAPPQLGISINWFTFVAVASAYGFSLTRRVREFRNSSTSDLLANISTLVLFVSLIGLVGNAWSTAFGTYGAALRDIGGEEVPSNSTTNAQAQVITEHNDELIVPAAFLATGAGIFSLIYNALQMHKARSGSLPRLRRGCNPPFILYCGISAVNVASWVSGAYYGAVIAESQANFALSGLLEQLAANIPQAIAVIVNNALAQLPFTEEMLANRYPAYMLMPVNPDSPVSDGDERITTPARRRVARGRVADFCRDAFHWLNLVLIYGANGVQSISNIGQLYVIMRKLGRSADESFYIALPFGIVMGIANLVVYWSFRTKPALQEANLFTDALVDRLMGLCSPTAPVSTPVLSAELVVDTGAALLLVQTDGVSRRHESQAQDTPATRDAFDHAIQAAAQGYHPPVVVFADTVIVTDRVVVSGSSSSSAAGSLQAHFEIDQGELTPSPPSPPIRQRGAPAVPGIRLPAPAPASASANALAVQSARSGGGSSRRGSTAEPQAQGGVDYPYG